MRSCLSKACGANPSFALRTVHGFELCYRVDGARLQLVIPRGKGLRRTLMEEVHNSLYGAHLGVRKTVAALQHRVWWPDMGKHVATFVRGCSVCQRVKDVNAKQQGLLQPLPVPTHPFQQWTMDFISDLPLVTVGNASFNGVLVLVDKFSKLCRLIPVFKGEGELSAPAVA